MTKRAWTDRKGQKLFYFRLSKRGVEQVGEVVNQESGQTRRDVVASVIERYAKAPFALSSRKTEILEAPLSSEVEQVVQDQADKADIPMGSALAQIVEHYLCNHATETGDE